MVEGKIIAVVAENNELIVSVSAVLNGEPVPFKTVYTLIDSETIDDTISRITTDLSKRLGAYQVESDRRVSAQAVASKIIATLVGTPIQVGK